jgi:hypothetical protein
MFAKMSTGELTLGGTCTGCAEQPRELRFGRCREDEIRYTVHMGSEYSPNAVLRVARTTLQRPLSRRTPRPLSLYSTALLRRARRNGHAGPDAPAVPLLTAPVTRLTCSGRSCFTGTGVADIVSTRELCVTVENAAQVTLRGITVESLTVRASGTATVTLDQCSIKKLYLTLRGRASFTSHVMPHHALVFSRAGGASIVLPGSVDTERMNSLDFGFWNSKQPHIVARIAPSPKDAHCNDEEGSEADSIATDPAPVPQMLRNASRATLAGLPPATLPAHKRKRKRAPDSKSDVPRAKRPRHSSPSRPSCFSLPEPCSSEYESLNSDSD